MSTAEVMSESEVAAVKVRERGILFSAPMVRAILEGRKTQTRRIVKPQPPTIEAVKAKAGDGFDIFTRRHGSGVFRVAGPVWAVRELMGREPDWRCPYGVPGDRLWVRETWCEADRRHRDRIHIPQAFYRADTLPDRDGDGERCRQDYIRAGYPYQWRPSIFMPRWASRITLEVTEVRVQRLQDISEEDAKAEGVTLEPQPGRLNGKPATMHPFSHRQAYVWLWDAINGYGSWASNPWVFVVSFKKMV